MLTVAAASFALLALAGGPTRARSGPPAQASPATLRRSDHSTVWKSETTGNEYRVRLEGDTLYAEWIDVPPDLARRGAYVRTECRRVESKWIGTTHSYLPCPQEKVRSRSPVKSCSLVTRIELDTVTPTRISGRAQTRKQFDCEHCRILEATWASFVWVPLGRKARPVTGGSPRQAR